MAEYKVQFEVFEGPLDLLLYLVKKEEVDIYEVNLTKIATQFIEYVDLMRELDLDIAGEFLVMASTLMYIKSRELLPKDQQAQVEGEEDEEDPNTKWGYIDSTGKVVIPLQFSAAHNFSEGMAAVLIDGKLGYINKEGKVVIKPQFDEAQKFEGGKARVRIIKEGYGYVDKQGNFVEPLKL